MNKFLLFLSILSLFLHSCSSDNSSTSTEEETILPPLGIQKIIMIEEIVSHKKPFDIHVEIVSDREFDSVPLYFSFVSDEGELNETAHSELEDANLTTTFIPKEQYALHATYIHLEKDNNLIEANISVPLDVPHGKYHIAVFLDINQTKENAENINFMHISESVITVENADRSLDIAILDASIKDDILLIDNDNIDETIYLNIKAFSAYHELNATQVNICLEFDGSCKPLNIYNKDTLSLNAVPTSSSFAVSILKEDKLDIYTLLDKEIHEGLIKITLINKSQEEEFNQENNTFSIPVTIYKKTTSSLSKASNKTSDTQVEFKSFSKSFNTTMRDSQFGIALTSEANMVFGSLNSYAKVNGDLDVRILGNDISIASLDTQAMVTYDSVEDTGYDIQILALGKNVFSSSKNLADLAEYKTIENAELTEEEENLTQEEKTEILKERQIELNEEGAEINSALEYSKEFSIEKSVEKEQVIMVSIVPITLKAGVTGAIGFDASIKLEGILKLHSEMGPTASLAGEASGGVGITGFSAGVEASFTFIENDFRGESDLEFIFTGDKENLRLKGILSESVVNTFNGPDGELNLYAEYTEPKICSKKISYCVKWKSNLKCKKKKHKVTHYPCGIKKVRPTLTIFKWDSGLSKNVTLLKKSQTLLNQKIY